MYKVMICEDEPIDRQALRKLILGQVDELALLEDCKDGSSAIERTLAENPDILILDIQMPKADGIEVVKQVRRKGYRGKIMIQTAYDLFSYAQDALNYGADAFLLKPIKHAQFLDTIRKFLEELNQPSPMPAPLAQELCDAMLAEYLFSPELEKPVLPSLPHLWNHGIFLCFSLPEEQKNLQELSPGYSGHAVEIGSVIQAQLPGDFRLLPIPHVQNQWMVFHAERAGTGLDQAILESAYMAMLLLQRLSHYGLFPLCRLTPFAQGLTSWQGAGNNLFANMQRQGVFELLHGCGAVRERMISPSRIREALARGIMPGEALTESRLVQDEASTRGESSYLLFAEGGAMLLSYLTVCEAEQPKKQVFFRQALETYPLPYPLCSASIRDWCYALLDQILQEYYRGIDLSLAILRRSCAYIKENYKCDLSVEDVAKQAGVSISYISHLFKKKLDISIINYLQDVRMERLMELLREKDYSILELSEMLGYHSHTYFCRVVRQRTGKTVTQLRQMVKEKAPLQFCSGAESGR